MREVWDARPSKERAAFVGRLEFARQSENLDKARGLSSCGYLLPYPGRDHDVELNVGCFRSLENEKTYSPNFSTGLKNFARGPLWAQFQDAATRVYSLWLCF